MAKYPKYGSKTKVYGYHKPKVDCFYSTLSYNEIAKLEDEKAGRYLAGIAVALLGFPAVQGLVASALGKSAAWVASRKTTESVIANTLALFGLKTAMSPTGSAMDEARTEKKYRFRLCEYKHIVDTKSSKWDSWTDYAHFSGFICYYVKDLNTGDEYLSHTEAITR